MNESTARIHKGDYVLTLEEWEYVCTRPDLPDCQRCGNGSKCDCMVNSVIYDADYDPNKDYGVIACACMGFLDCPACHRGEASDLISLITATDKAVRIELQP